MQIPLPFEGETTGLDEWWQLAGDWRPTATVQHCERFFTAVAVLLQHHYTRMSGRENEMMVSGHCTIRWTLYYCIDRTEPLTYYTYSCMYACADIHHAQLLYTLLRDILKVYPATLSSKCVLALSSMCTITHT